MQGCAVAVFWLVLSCSLSAQRTIPVLHPGDSVLAFNEADAVIDVDILCRIARCINRPLRVESIEYGLADVGSLLPYIPGAAQSDPCAQPWPTTQTVIPGVTYRIQVCAAGNPTEAALIVDGNERPRQRLVRLSSPNAAGVSLFDGSVDVTFPAGSHTLEATAWANGIQGPRVGILAVQAGAIVPPPVIIEYACTIPSKPGTYANGDLKLTVRCPKGAALIKGDRVTVKKP